MMSPVKACPPNGRPTKTKWKDQLPQLELTAFLAAVALFCSTLEYLIPKPLPFIRLGLANLPLMLSFPLLSWGYYLWLLALKVIGQGLVNGTLFSYVFALSVVSTAASGLFMRLLWRFGGMGRRHARRCQEPQNGTELKTDQAAEETRKAPRTVERSILPVFSYVGISVAGALISNCAQILTAQILFFGNTIWVIATPMLAVGLVTSVLLGWMANIYAGRSGWYVSLLAGNGFVTRYRRTLETAGPWRPDARSVPVGIGLALLPAIFFQSSLSFLAVDTLLAIFLATSVGRKFKPLPNLLLLLSMALVHLMQPSGKVLWDVGAFTLTAGSLLEGTRKALILISMVYVSQYMTAGKPDMPGKLGKLLAVQLAYFGEFSQRWRNGNGTRERGDMVNRLDSLMERVGTEDVQAVSNKELSTSANRKTHFIRLIGGFTTLSAMYCLLAIRYI